MITTTVLAGAGECSRFAPDRARWLPVVRRGIVALGLCSVLAGCTNSKLIIAPVYNRLDDQIRSEFDKLGDFNDAQTAAFEQALGTFHVWHRQAELPQYSMLLAEIAGSIAQPERTTREDITGWMTRIEAHSLAARRCYPANFMPDTIRTLTDDQINTIERRFKEQRSSNQESYNARTPAERIARRLQRMEKWAGRINLELNDDQRSLLRTSLGRQISLHRQYFALTDQWNRQLFTLARDQQARDYEEKLKNHMATLWSLLETHYPDEWHANRVLWQDTAFSFVQSLTEAQRRGVSQWLEKMSGTLLAVSKDEPSFTPIPDPSVGCQVSPGSS